MSRFPLTDIIPNVCVSLSYKDIMTLLLVNCETNKRLRELTISQNKIIMKHNCAFDITEIITAGVIMRTTAKINTSCNIVCDCIMEELKYAGSDFCGLIQLVHLAEIEPHMRRYIIYVKNNMAKYCAVLIMNHGNIDSLFGLEHNPIPYADFINALLERGENLPDINVFTRNVSLANLMRRYLGGDTSLVDHDAGILQTFKQIDK